MARHATRRLIDIVFALAILACVIAMARPEPIEVCRSTRVEPRYEALFEGGLTIAVVLAELDGQPPGHRAWSHAQLVRALRERGFVERADRFERGDIAIDIVLVEDVRDELTAALRTHDVVYYNGHSERGEMSIVPPDAYRVIFLDTCWSTQLYSPRLVGDRDVLTNPGNSITGSIESVALLVDGFAARRSWDAITTAMNTRANERASKRPVRRVPEEYRLDARCE